MFLFAEEIPLVVSLPDNPDPARVIRRLLLFGNERLA